MTRDEVMKLEAGSELDALIAERIMGITPKKEASFPVWADGRYFIEPGDYYYEVGGGVFELPGYSTDIAAAWKVAEKMRKEWADWDVGNSPNGDGWHCVWGVDGAGWYDAQAETAPLAICRAALLAVCGG